MRKSTEARSGPRRLLGAAMPVSAYWNPGSRALRITPLVLLAAALMALAVFFAPGPQPAGAQETATTVWTGALTAETTAASTYGCDNTVSGKECSTTSVLDDDDFTRGAVTYTITKITVSSGTLDVKFGQSIPADLRSKMALDVDDKRLYLSEGGTSATDYTWSDTGLAWAQARPVSLSLSVVPLEIVFHHFATLTAKPHLNAGELGCSDFFPANLCSENLSSNSFSYGGVDWEISAVRLHPSGTFDIQFYPASQVPKAEGLTLRVGVEKTVNGVTTVEYRSFNLTGATNFGDGFRWRRTGMTWQENASISLVLTSGRHFSSLTFEGTTVDAKTYTAGAPTPKHSLSLDEVIGLKLPMATGGGYLHTYTATGLPAGLSMGYDLVIRGTPEAATQSPATVTYTVTDEANNTDSLTFNVSVAPPVVFNTEDIDAFNGTYLEYTIGQTGRLSHTLPSASGGHGGLTYHLEYAERGEGELRTINDDAPGLSFDAATRVLTSDTGVSEPSEEAVYPLKYSAVDQNGGMAVAFHNVAVRAAPTLPEIADQSFTVGATESITLPKAEDGSLLGLAYLDYALSPEVEGLTFTRGTFRHRTLSGTPRFAGSTEMTYTVTDANGVSDSQTFTINVVNGPSAPSSAPTSVFGGQAASRGTAWMAWDAVAGATEYVVQVIADGGSYPDNPVNSAPGGVAVDVRSAIGQAVILLESDGDYKARVAARNADGVGPWSSEVSFTVKVGGV